MRWEITLCFPGMYNQIKLEIIDLPSSSFFSQETNKNLDEVVALAKELQVILYK